MTRSELTGDLFGDEPPSTAPAGDERLEDGAWLLRGFALPAAPKLVEGVRTIAAVSPCAMIWMSESGKPAVRNRPAR